MTLDNMKEYFFAEQDELGLASEKDIMRLCGWLEGAGYDADLAYQSWVRAKEEIEYLLADAMAEFG